MPSSIDQRVSSIEVEHSTAAEHVNSTQASRRAEGASLPHAESTWGGVKDALKHGYAGAARYYCQGLARIAADPAGLAELQAVEGYEAISELLKRCILLQENAGKNGEVKNAAAFREAREALEGIFPQANARENGEVMNATASREARKALEGIQSQQATGDDPVTSRERDLTTPPESELSRYASVKAGLHNLGRSGQQSLTGIWHRTDAYQALARMDDAELLAKLRKQPTLDQVITWMARHGVTLNPDQSAVVAAVMLPEAQHLGPGDRFSAQLHAALANGSLRLTEEQLTAHLGGRAALTPEYTRLLDCLASNDLSASFNELRIQAQRLPELLRESSLPDPVKKELLVANSRLNRELTTLEHGASPARRLFSASFLPTAALPLLVAFKSGDKPYSSSLVAHFAKSGMLMVGMGMSELTNGRANIDHFLNRYFVTLLTNAVAGGPVFAKAEKVQHSVAFGIPAAIAASVCTLGVFNYQSIHDAVSNALHRNQRGDPDTATAAVGEQVDTIQAASSRLKAAVSRFRDDHEITDHLNSSLSYVATQANDMSARYAAAEARRTGTEHQPIALDNPDAYPKWGLVGITTLISAALVLLMDSLAGRADYAADAVWCISEMAKVAHDPEADMQKAVQTFKEIVGLGVIMAGLFTVDRFTHAMEQGPAGYAAVTTALTLANLTVPGMAGDAAGRVAGKALESASHGIAKARLAATAAGDAVAKRRPTPGGARLAANVFERLVSLSQAYPTAAEPDLERQAPGATED